MLAAIALTAVATAELLWWNAAFRLNAEPRSLYAMLDTPAAADAQVIEAIGRALRERQAAGARPRIEVYGMGGPWQNMAVVRGFEADNGYNPLRIGFYDRLVQPGEFELAGRSCAIFRPPSTATTARSRTRWGSNSWCSASRSRRCRISRIVRSPMC